MHLTSINLGTARKVGQTMSGIYKNPVGGEVLIGIQSLDHDTIVDTRFHGGLDQAVYVYGDDDYAWWTKKLGTEIGPGTFGDNLTISELSSLDVNVGDQFEIGPVVLEATAPRIPCSTLGRRMNDPRFPVAFRRAERSGFYCRVLKPGKIHAGLRVQLRPFPILIQYPLFNCSIYTTKSILRGINCDEH